MKLSIVDKTPIEDNTLLEKVAKATFSYLKAQDRPGEIEVKFVTRAEIQKLNYNYRKIDAPTDVLSFNISDKPLVGQIFICYTYASDEARKNAKSPNDEVLLLLVHGILHVFGYDHTTKIEESRMFGIEKEILMEEGIVR